MKKIISAVSAVMLAVSSFATALTASAEGNTAETPSGISYSEVGSSIDRFVKEREGGLASCEVSVFNSGGVIYSGYYGHSDIENDILADEQTVYEWGSCSKLLVWTSVMQQWERGNIDLDTDIREYLPNGFLTKLQYPDEKITMLNLMNHNAGFQESFYENQQASPDNVYDTLEEAVKVCECYQSYHVGEYTAYSNWGTALAAYIVEQTSDTDYVTYVHENIFEPLEMEHTCIDPKMRDNNWVANKRHELKCYLKTADTSENYGECLYGIQLFPAGAAIGTLEDFAKFGQAFVAKDCPLFENNATRNEMFSATSYYGDTDIAKNCHGLWTSEYKVQTLGHGGNTGGCSSNLVFDPESSLGIVVMTNEQGETAFNYGIPGLIFGDVTQRDKYKNAVVTSTEDVSGYYYSKRSIVSGAAKVMSLMGGLMPWSKNDDGTYSMKLFGFNLNDETKLVQLADHEYVMLNNGMNMFMYIDNGRIEMMSSDYKRSGTGALGTVVVFEFILFGIACLVTLLVKHILCIVRKIRKSEKKYNSANWQILAQQSIYSVSAIILVLFIMSMGTVIGAVNPVFTAVSGILAAVLALISLANGGVLCYNTIRADVRTSTKVKQLIWSLLGIAYTVFIITMQLYNFWNL